MRAAALLALLTSSGCLSSLRFSDTTSEASSRSSGASSGATADAIGPGPSTLVVCGSALVLGAFGAITTTIYEGHVAAQAQVKAEEFRKLHPVQLQPAGSPPPPPLPLPEAPSEPTPPPPPPISLSLRSGERGRGEGRSVNENALIVARAWLRANQLQLKQDLAIGAGPAIDDLAGLAGISPSHRAHFGKVLQRHREQLRASSEVTLEEAARVMSTVGGLVLDDGVLKGDVVALQAR